MARAIYNSILKRDAGLVDPANMRIGLECRNYELGCILWSFGKRSDLAELRYN